MTAHEEPFGFADQKLDFLKKVPPSLTSGGRKKWGRRPSMEVLLWKDKGIDAWTMLNPLGSMFLLYSVTIRILGAVLIPSTYIDVPGS